MRVFVSVKRDRNNCDDPKWRNDSLLRARGSARFALGIEHIHRLAGTQGALLAAQRAPLRHLFVHQRI